MKKTHKNFGMYFKDEKDSNALIVDRKNILLRDIVEGYEDRSEDEEGGVVGWGGILNIRPKFQRAFIVGNDDYWQTNLLDSILNGKPIGIMYFGIVDDPTSPFKYINIDGQQRIMTFSSFVSGDKVLKANINGRIKGVQFNSLPEDWQERILNYPLDVCICRGSETAILKWFKTINQPHSILTEQELLNAAYSGQFVESAKRYFSTVKKSQKNKEIVDPNSIYFGNKYSLHKEACRQDFLEMALDWITIYQHPEQEKDMAQRIEQYMSIHVFDDNADELIAHYKKVVDWIRELFNPEGSLSQKAAQNVKWGRLYAKYSQNHYSDEEKRKINERVEELLEDPEVTAHSNVFEYVLMGDNVKNKNMLTLRAFSKTTKNKMYNMQKHIDPFDGKKYDIKDMEAHHIIAWENGGKTEIENGIMVSKETHKKLIHGGVYNSEQVMKIKHDFLESLK